MIEMNESAVSSNYKKRSKPINEHEKLRIKLKELYGSQWQDEWSTDLPKKWKISVKSLLILPVNCFQLPEWHLNQALWKTVAECNKQKKLLK